MLKKKRKKNIYSEEQAYLVKKLIEARLEAGLTQLQVAKKLEKTQSYVSKVESGQLRIDVVELKKFAQLYKKKLEFFIKDLP